MRLNGIVAPDIINAGFAALDHTSGFGYATGSMIFTAALLVVFASRRFSGYLLSIDYGRGHITMLDRQRLKARVYERCQLVKTELNRRRPSLRGAAINITPSSGILP